MLVLIGASATGKSAICNELIKSYDMKKFVTTTTRKERHNEVDGVDYHFVDVDTFLRQVYNNEFIEHQQYNGNYYGSYKKELADNKVVILEPNGYYNFLHQGIKCFAVYLNIDENVRYQRMLLRGDSVTDAKKRIETDKVVFNQNLVNQVDFVFDKADLTIEEIAKIIYEKYQESIR